MIKLKINNTSIIKILKKILFNKEIIFPVVFIDRF